MNLSRIVLMAENEARKFLFIKKAKKMPYRSAYDFESCGFRVDIKSAKIKRLFSSQYNFILKKKNKERLVADFYLFMGYKNKKLQNAYLIPRFIVNVDFLGIPEFIPNKFEPYRLK